MLNKIQSQYFFKKFKNPFFITMHPLSIKLPYIKGKGNKRYGENMAKSKCRLCPPWTTKHYPDETNPHRDYKYMLQFRRLHSFRVRLQNRLRFLFPSRKGCETNHSGEPLRLRRNSNSQFHPCVIRLIYDSLPNLSSKLTEMKEAK